MSTRHAAELERGRFALEEVRALKVHPRTSSVVRGGPVIPVRTFLGEMRHINLRASSAPASNLRGIGLISANTRHGSVQQANPN